MYFIPEILKLITPVGMLLATLFTVGRFNNYSEMTAINSSGISKFRFSIPILLFGFLITIISVYFNGWVVPKSNSEKFNFERKYLSKNLIPGSVQNLHIMDSENKILSIGNYIESNGTGINASIQIFDTNNLSKLNYRFDIQTIQWDSIRNEWKLINVTKREFYTADSQYYKKYDSIYISDVPEIKRIYLSPAQIIKRQLKPDELLLSDLNEFIISMEDSGQDVSKAKVDYYSKISFPFANLIIILFGISLTATNRKSGAAIQFGISILVTFIYLGFIKISQTFGYSGEMNPVLTAWLANIFFFVLAIINLLRINIFWK